MPMLDSFLVDHVKMPSPGLRVAKHVKTPNGDIITVYDVRFAKPNEEIIDERAMHTLEHLFAGYMRDNLSNYEIIDISPMGCRTGFYMSVIGEPEDEEVIEAWKKSMQNVLETDTIPEANVYQCGSCYMHSLDGAKKVAEHILNNEIVIMDNEALALNPENIPNECNVDTSKVKILGK
ncbi:S-Ribosylhomocysteinase (LuxS) [Nautilia profundicola AmH]|uniref:S-ribosylhomocysteine lyase n=1 Tax=Nautilia profundicola (strain ATCC BAA-1463 / DSM 18972 / AmH) TaxID=598659 RepID=B9L8B0_NAUPA|nr:S-ribosylhomocysteine lyase [Nautilia profundicola]ACM92657.1 S-Ribosylhomocysteinase (LuxS) [Nautilia profundicola AmH]